MQQRLLLHNYIEENDELTGEVAEYSDEGCSGDDFDRPAFQRMLEDAKAGRIATIVVSDIACLGENGSGVEIYLEQIFPLLGVRLLAVSSGYDGRKYYGDGVKLDGGVVKDFISQSRSGDISRKRKSALQEKWKQGKSTSGRLPYGYVKDPSAKGGWGIDPEAAEVVKLIFDRANQGWTTSMIADHLNENRVMTPGVYREKKHQYSGTRKVPDRECLWDTGKVRIILCRYEYTGAFVHHYRRTIQAGSHITRSVPEDERYITEAAHDAIVTREEFTNAQAAIFFMSNPKYKLSNKYPLKGKIRCGVCTLAMSYMEQPRGPVIYCSHKLKSGRYSGCPSGYTPFETIESAVLTALRQKLNIPAEKLTKELADEYVEMVYVFGGGEIEVNLRCFLHDL